MGRLRSGAPAVFWLAPRLQAVIFRGLPSGCGMLIAHLTVRNAGLPSLVGRLGGLVFDTE